MVITVDVLRSSEYRFLRGSPRKASVEMLELLLSDPRSAIVSSSDDYGHKNAWVKYRPEYYKKIQSSAVLPETRKLKISDH